MEEPSDLDVILRAEATIYEATYTSAASWPSSFHAWEPWLATCRRMVWAAVCITLTIGWAALAAWTCGGARYDCYRVGNVLDNWFSREQERAYAGPRSDEDWGRLRTDEQRVWEHAIGPGLLRLLRFDSLRTSLLEHAYFTRAPWLVAPDVWRQRLKGKQGCGRLYLCDDETFQKFVPQMARSLRALVASYRWFPLSHTAGCQQLDLAEGTCVVHFRIGDERTAHVSRAVHGFIRAAKSFPEPPKFFDVLDGGKGHLCTRKVNHTDCGASAHHALLSGLRAHFPRSVVRAPKEAPATNTLNVDGDFLKLACAPMVIIGTGSFGLYGAMANQFGAVRYSPCAESGGDPRCVLSLPASSHFVGEQLRLSNANASELCRPERCLPIPPPGDPIR